MDALEKVSYLEKKYTLNSIEVDGFHPWTYIRGTLHRCMHTVYDQPDIYKSVWTKRIEKIHIFSRILRMALRSCKVVKKNVDILFISQPRRIAADGIYECIYTDDLADIYPNSVTLESTYKNSHYTPARTKNLIYLDRVIIKSSLYSIFMKYMHRKKYNEIYNRIANCMKLPLNELFQEAQEKQIDKWIARITRLYFVYKSRYSSYEKILNILSPKLIIEVDEAYIGNMIINEIAKKRSIVTMALQRGLLFTKNALKYPPDAKISQFPDKVLVFSEYWKKSASLPIDNDCVIPVGFPYFEKQVKKYKSEVEGFGEKKVVFLSQPITGFDKQLTTGFYKLALDVSVRMKAHNWKVVFKLHPVEHSDWQFRYPLLVNSDIEIVGHSGKSLYEVFADCSALVGMYSTSIFEGIGFGLAAFIYDTPYLFVVEELLHKGYATKILDCDSLCHALLNMNDYDCSKGMELWKTNALENINNVIFELLNN